VFVAGLVPLAVVLWRRAQAGAWGELPAAFRNGGWKPSAPAPQRPVEARVVVASRVQNLVQRGLPVLGLAGLAAWLAWTPMQADVPPLVLDRAAAEAAADAALKARGVTLGPEWRRMSMVRLLREGQAQTSHRFVWREAGPAAYRALVGSTLAPPLWVVRYAMFEGDVAARAEEWWITIESAGVPRQISHVLPEARPGARLEQEAARALAEREISVRFGIDPAALKPIAAEEKQRPARTDWLFTYADRSVDVGKDGEARINVSVAGDADLDARRFVHVPEAWLRAERERESGMQIAAIVAGLLIVLAALAALVVAVKSWLAKQCDMRALMLVLAIGFGAAAARIVVMWPALAMQFRTTEPILSQGLLGVSRSLLAAALGGLVVALLAGVGAWSARIAPRTVLAGALPPWAAGAAAALFVAGATALAGGLGSRTSPLWPSLASESAASPVAAAALQGVGSVASIGMGLFVLHILDRVTAGWTRRGWLAIVVVIALIAGLVAMETEGAAADIAEQLIAGIAAGLVAGLIAAAVVYCVLRFDARTVPGFVVAAGLVHSLEEALLKGTSAGWVAFAIAAAVSVAVGIAATRYISRPMPSTTGS
jgi:hypothetical protein